MFLIITAVIWAFTLGLCLGRWVADKDWIMSASAGTSRCIAGRFYRVEPEKRA